MNYEKAVNHGVHGEHGEHGEKKSKLMQPYPLTRSVGTTTCSTLNVFAEPAVFAVVKQRFSE